MCRNGQVVVLWGDENAASSFTGCQPTPPCQGGDNANCSNSGKAVRARSPTAGRGEWVESPRNPPAWPMGGGLHPYPHGRLRGEATTMDPPELSREPKQGRNLFCLTQQTEPGRKPNNGGDPTPGGGPNPRGPTSMPDRPLAPTGATHLAAVRLDLYWSRARRCIGATRFQTVTPETFQLADGRLRPNGMLWVRRRKLNDLWAFSGWALGSYTPCECSSNSPSVV